jgi:4,5-DOPA dioxygenase extradiol
MYPAADIPVFQFSVDANAAAEVHFKMGRELSALRDRGVMILGSGNVVHNLSLLDGDMKGGFPWADEFDAYVKNAVAARRFADLTDYGSAGSSARLAFTTPDHFFPLLYALGASREDDELAVSNDTRMMGAMSMTCYAFA